MTRSQRPPDERTRWGAAATQDWRREWGSGRGDTRRRGGAMRACEQRVDDVACSSSAILRLSRARDRNVATSAAAAVCVRCVAAGGLLDLAHPTPRHGRVGSLATDRHVNRRGRGLYRARCHDARRRDAISNSTLQRWQLRRLVGIAYVVRRLGDLPSEKARSNLKRRPSSRHQELSNHLRRGVGRLRPLLILRRAMPRGGVAGAKTGSQEPCLRLSYC